MVSTYRTKFYAFCQTVVITVVISTVCLAPAWQATAFAETQSFPYPELLVTPSASERLNREAAQERKTAWKTHMAIQVSALMTIASGYIASQDNTLDEDDDLETSSADIHDAGNAAMMVGTGWVLITAGLSAIYRPYKKGYNAIKSMPMKTKRQRLTRERMAEEHLLAPASLGAKLEWLSFFTNLGAGAYVASAAKDSQDLTGLMGALAACAAFSPMLFEGHWRTVAGHHEDYKKKIYGPLASTGIMINPYTKKPMPIFGLSLQL